MENAYINSVNLNQNTDFPYLVLNVVGDESYPRNPGFQVMHWHEDLQFIYVIDGEIEIVTLSGRELLKQGEGVFINKNVVHLVGKVGTCHYNSFIFPDRFLKFYPGSPAERLVDKIVGHSELPLVVIRGGEENRAVLQALRKLMLLEAKKDAAYPYEVLCALCNLWLVFSKTVTLSDRHQQNHISEERVSSFLQYIALHYGEDISLDTLAASANVSKSECLRCFQTVLHTTPYRYLTEYRLSKSAELLRQTNEPITIIAGKAGFSHISHFGKCFREKTGLSPSEYRKTR